MLVVVGFILIIVLVIIHEAGHYFAARRNGIEVEEFGVGFPPKAKSLGVRDGTEFTLNWLPLGGFVKLKGEHDADTTKGSFGAASLWAKVQVMLAGVVMNFLTAFVLFMIVALIGMPQLVDNQYTVASNETINRQDVLAGVADGSPAAQAGIEDNDAIVSIAQTDCADTCTVYRISTADDLRSATPQLLGQTVDVTIKKPGGEVSTVQATLNSQQAIDDSRVEQEACLANGTNLQDCPAVKGGLGVVPTEFVQKRYTWAAPLVAAGTTVQLTQATLEGLGSIVSGLAQGDTEQATEQVSGVVGVGFIFDASSFLGPVFMLMIVAVISLSLAIMNVLPIPALDGGRLFVTLLFRALNKPLTKELEERIHGTGFAVLMVLFILITIVDVQRFIV